MSSGGVVVLVLGATVAFANGGNDVSKGIATLLGSGVTDCRRALCWGTAWTVAGGLAGALFAQALLETFGKGLLSPGVAPTFPAALAALVGAAAWVLFATRTGLPVSTTHAIVGSLGGVGAVAYGWHGVHWAAMGSKVILPLCLSPVAAFLLAALLSRALKRRPGEPSAACLCAEWVPVAEVGLDRGPLATATLAPALPALRLSAGTVSTCATEQPRALRLTVDHLHWLTSGAVSFARAMNDAPKIVALVFSAAALASSGAPKPAAAFTLVVAGMAAGSLAGGLRVARVLAYGITPLTPREGFIANAVTATLVAAGAMGGLPMSTTHVASGSIVGAGTQREFPNLNRRTLRDIALAWIVTLPAAAALGIVAYAGAKAIWR